jgi:D-alanyl-lipoteichoic acid acyltransferase DltB (MBOAT superfamily)
MHRNAPAASNRAAAVSRATRITHHTVAVMLFNSGVFLQFFAAFVLLYWLARNRLALRNWLILAASYLFYGWWAPDKAEVFSANALLGALWHCRFLALLIATSLLDFSIALGLDRLAAPRSRKWLLTASIAANLGVLGFFKYHDFFARSFAELLSSAGITVEARTLGLILPVGISFYTFQSMSYTIDVYRRELAATRSLTRFLAFVSFFPQLVAGPIERAKHLLPQFSATRLITLPMLEEGIWLILWGMFKKVVLADNFAPLAEMVFDNTSLTAASVILGTLAFGLQIYCDFSGYSDIARGTARVLGFDIMWNFSLPYSATSLREFWQRWHISLSTWLRDYLYIPLGGNRLGSGRTCLNLIVTMLLGGLWHGAAWNFVLWGLWHGFGLVVSRAPIFNSQFSILNSRSRRALCWLATMLFVFYGWLLFRAKSFDQIMHMTRALTDFSAPPWIGSFALNLVVFAAPLALMEFWQRRTGNLLAALSLPAWARTTLQGALIIAIVLFWQKKGATFIYFQF